MEKWKVAYASVIGTSHQERGAECQDYSDQKVVALDGDQVLIAVAADGAGSAENGYEGAELACTQFIKEVELHLLEGGVFEDLNEGFGGLWLEYVQRRIADRAEAVGKTSRDFACTFLGSVLTDESAVFFQVGDGGIVYSPVERSNSYFWGIEPEESVYANTTNFITDSSASEKLRNSFLSQPVKSLVMFTDGLQSLAVNYSEGASGIPHAPFLTPMLAPLHRETNLSDINDKLTAYLSSPAINNRTDDDKTIILISRNENGNDNDIQAENIGESIGVNSGEIVETTSPDIEGVNARIDGGNI